MRLKVGPKGRAAAAFLGLAILPFALRAETVVLRNGLRLNVTSYQLLGEKYRLQLSGGFVEVPAEEVAAIEPQVFFVSEPPKAEPPAVAPYRELVEAAAVKYKIDADLISSVMAIESNFDPKAVSRRNARGLMQLMPETAMHFGVKDVFDPKENVDAGTHYLRDLLERYNNDLVLALAAYNAGPERVYGRVPPFRETRNYVVRVKRNYDQRKSEQGKVGDAKAGAVRKDLNKADATAQTEAAKGKTSGN